MSDPIRILSENPIEQLWLRLSRLESVPLARKAVDARSIALGQVVESDVANRKAVARHLRCHRRQAHRRHQRRHQRDRRAHERQVPIGPELRPILVEAVKSKLPLARVITSRKGTTPSRQHLLDVLVRLEVRKHLPRRSFHSLRHYFCTSLLRRGADVETVRIVAGHESVQTTGQYLHARVEDARRAMSVGQLAGNGPVG